MSVNITVSGKFSKQQILNPEGYKKQLEDERRKLRLQQVRSQSKELARKIRNEVSQEKQRQLRNLEAAKTQELNCWRKSVIQQKQNDFQRAIKQVGSAHVAAAKHNVMESLKEQVREKKTNNPASSGSAAPPSTVGHKTSTKENRRKPLTIHLTTPKKQTILKAAKAKPNGTEPIKKKAKLPKKMHIEKSKTKTKDEVDPKKGGNVCFDDVYKVIGDSDSEEFSETEHIDVAEIDLSDTSSLSDISLNLGNQNGTKQTQTISSNDRLQRIPAVVVNVETEPEQTQTNGTKIAAIPHVVDKHVETNRQFDCVVENVESESIKTNTVTTASQTAANDKKSLEELPPEKSHEDTAPLKRYTQITDLLAKQKRNELEKKKLCVDKGQSYTVLWRNNSEKDDLPAELNEESKPQKSPSPKKKSPKKSLMYTVVQPETASSEEGVGDYLNVPESDNQNKSRVVACEMFASKGREAPSNTPNRTPSRVETIITLDDPAPKIYSTFPQTGQNSSTSITVQKKARHPSRNAAPQSVPRISSASVQTTTISGKDTNENVAVRRASVQSYDYNNKHAMKVKLAQAKALPENNYNEPNAMEEAQREKERIMLQEKENEELRQRSDARGQMALEREKVRRDCADLTEKLDALMHKRTTLMPSDANLHGQAYLAGKSAQKEAKLNSAIEELLNRPTIITCPEVRKEIPNRINPALSEKYYSSANLNIGAGAGGGARLLSGDSDNVVYQGTDTDESKSILLGCIDDQRDQIKSEISHCDESSSKSIEKREKLLQLLKRIESLRESLLIEINKKFNIEYEPIGDSDCSITKSSEEKPKMNAFISSSSKKEQELKEREKLLQKELEEVIRTQQKLKSRAAKSTTLNINGKQIRQQTIADKPLEIVIKVKGNSKNAKHKSNKMRAKHIVPPPQRSNTKLSLTETQNGSYDSNSTVYHSMPSALNIATEQFVQRVGRLGDSKKSRSISLENTRSSSTTSAEIHQVEFHRRPRTHLNPLISQYVQRLLGMTRESVRALEVSTSEFESPSSSVVNISTNVAATKVNDGTLSEERLQRIEQFVTENRYFINDLEESLRSHSNENVEANLRHFENIWREQLKRNAKKNSRERPKKECVLESSKGRKEKEKLKKPAIKTTPKSTHKAVQRPERSAHKKGTSKGAKVIKASAPEPIVQDGNKETDAYATQSQLNRYAELTKNCSARIAELTELINKVRQEKQKIMEVTLSSVSENERHSTEYADLPGARNRNERANEDSTKKVCSENIPQHIERVPIENATPVEPLEKYKQTGRSRDSGISMPSRPVTALDNDTEIEPQSIISSTQTTSNNNIPSSSTSSRKCHPPPTIHRYSPQLPEEDVVHELSTIVEVDTPATSRINTSTQHPAPEKQNLNNSVSQPILFPTFEEYIKDLNLDLSALDHEESLRMEQEYNELIGAIKEGKGKKAYTYEEFPTLITYLKSISGKDQTIDTPETIEDLFGYLRLARIIAKPFPSHKEYLEGMCGNSVTKFIDSESLENLTEHYSCRSESESDTLNIEAELKRRNILKRSFHSSANKQHNAVSPTKDSKHKANSKSSTLGTTLETGVERLSSGTSDSASDKFHSELRALGLKWTKSMHIKEKQAAALSSSTSDCLQPLAKQKDHSKSLQKDMDKNNIPCSEMQSDSETTERPLNLRDFLTRQLLKHVTANSTCDSSVSGASLRSQFFMAVLDSMTPTTSPRGNTVNQSENQNNLERQKTSTPVRKTPVKSRPLSAFSKSNETSSSPLLSPESNLSSLTFFKSLK